MPFGRGGDEPQLWKVENAFEGVRWRDETDEAHVQSDRPRMARHPTAEALECCFRPLTMKQTQLRADELYSVATERCLHLGELLPIAQSIIRVFREAIAVDRSL